MKTLLTIVLVCGGMLLMACAGVGWAIQENYVCYNQVQLCGNYAGYCYPASGTCANNQTRIHSVMASSLILGACIATPSLACYDITLYCSYYYYPSSNCSDDNWCSYESVQHYGCWQ